MKILKLDPNQIITLNDYPLYSNDVLKEYTDRCKTGKKIPLVPLISKEIVVNHFDVDILRKFREFEKDNTQAEYFMLDGSHRTTALTLAGYKINSIIYEETEDITKAKNLIVKGDILKSGTLDKTLEENCKILNEHFKKKPYFMTVKQKADKLFKEGHIPNTNQIYIIEHLEPKLFPWCMIEYKHISLTVGKSNLWFTNINPKDKNAKNLKKYGKVFHQSVRTMNLPNVCVLDPQTPKTLEPEDSKQFNYFIFGGILGDYPPKKRTKKELTKFIEDAQVRNIGKKQFSTDNAVYVTWRIANGESMSMMKFKNKFELPINKVETIILPYLYPIVHGKQRISEELIRFLRNKKGF